MGELKTKQTNESVYDFINKAADTEQKKNDCLALLEIMELYTGYKPKMWGTSMVGFGSYYYESERSTQKGEWFLAGFSPRKAAISVYAFSGLKEHEHLLNDLGKFKMGKACIYIKKLSDINVDQLKKIITENIKFLASKHKVT